jgi:hypothetical protein
MKKFNFIYTTFGLCLMAFLFLSNSSNPPVGNTGSAGTTCASCHSGGSYGGNMTITGVPATIQPNAVYAITVTLNKTTGTSGRAGFQLNVINAAGTRMGTLAAGTGVGVITSGVHQYARQNAVTAFVNTGVGSKSWTFNWTAPATTTNNNITFYAAGNIADGTGGTGADQIVTSTASGTFAAPLTLTESSHTNVSCFGGNNGASTVTASGGSGCTNSFVWSNGLTGATVTGLVAGTYTVTATCGSSTGTRTVTITQPATALTVNTTGSTLNCSNLSGGTASASASGASGGYTYLWSNGGNTASISGLTANTYTVTVTSGTCKTTKTAVVNPPTPAVANAGADVTVSCLAPNTTLSASGGVSYLWSNGETTAAINVSPTLTTTYSVTATAANACTASDDVVVTYNNSITCYPILNVKALLNNYDTLSQEMSAYYTQNMTGFPLSDPYRTMFSNNFTHVNNPTVDMTTQSALSNNFIVDWVFLELRTGTSGSTTVVYTKAALLQKDGDVVAMDGVSPVSFNTAPLGDYFICLRHRNHLGFRTATTYTFGTMPLNLNLANNTIALHGSTPTILVSSTARIMIGGEANNDGSIDGSDSTIWELDNGGFNDYTKNSDYNLDGSIDGSDAVIWEVNNGKFEELN